MRVSSVIWSDVALVWIHRAGEAVDEFEASLVEIAKYFRISNVTLHNWLKKTDVEDVVRPGLNDADSAEIHALKKRARLLEQENEILR